MVACLDGVLSLQPKHYLSSQHDVVRLSPSLPALWEQQVIATDVAMTCVRLKSDRLRDD